MNANITFNGNTKAGTITFALGLILLGVLLLTSNFAGQEILTASLKLWPVLLIGLGLEYFIRRYLNSKSHPEAETKFHIPALIAILFISMTAYSVQQVVNVIKLPDVNNLISETISGANFAYSHTDSRDIAVKTGVSRLVLDGLECKVDLVPSPDDKVHIKAITNAWGPSENEAQRRAEMVKLNIDEGDIVRISLLDIEQENMRRSPQTYVRVMVPKGINISVDNNYGDLKADSLQNNFEIRSDSGRYDLSRIQGDIVSDVRNGQQYFNNISGAIRVSSESGEIKITDPQKDVTVKNGNGQVEISKLQPVSSIYNISNDTGSTSIRIAPSSNVSIEAVADVGEISGDLKGLQINKTQEDGPGHKATATLGTGQGKISIHNNTGQININQN